MKGGQRFCLRNQRKFARLKPHLFLQLTLSRILDTFSFIDEACRKFFHNAFFLVAIFPNEIYISPIFRDDGYGGFSYHALEFRHPAVSQCLFPRFNFEQLTGKYGILFLHRKHYTKTMSTTTRHLEMDLLKGLAVVGMIVFHFFYILNFYDIVSNDMYSGFFLVLARTVQFIFIGGVGVGLVFSYLKSNSISASKPSTIFFKKNLKRALILIGIAYGVTLVTYMFVGERFVRFGILHLLAVNIFLFRYLVHRPTRALGLSFCILLLTPLLKETVTTEAPLYYLWYAIGLAEQGRGAAIDYFSLLPWSAVTGFGIVIGHLVYNSRFTHKIHIPVFQPLVRLFSPLLYLGRHSLIIYLVHVPLIIFLLLVFRVLDWNNFL